MREIEFRMYDKVNKKYYHDEDAMERLPEWSYDPGLFGVVFEQYTGLKDKNGKKIFEGDIVKGWMHNEHETFLVKYKSDMYNSGFVGESVDGFSSIHIWYKGLEIIGNQNDNPELLM